MVKWRSNAAKADARSAEAICIEPITRANPVEGLKRIRTLFSAIVFVAIGMGAASGIRLPRFVFWGARSTGVWWLF